MLADSSREKEDVETGHSLRGRVATTNRNKGIKWSRKNEIGKLRGQTILYSSEEEEIAIL